MLILIAVLLAVVAALLWRIIAKLEEMHRDFLNTVITLRSSLDGIARASWQTCAGVDELIEQRIAAKDKGSQSK